jgi:hypothetical protein
MAVIKVPKTPRSAFNKNRPASGLLQAQIEQLEAAVGIYPAQAGATRRKKVRTEGQAAAYIHDLTGQIRPEGAKPYAGAKAGSTPAAAPRGAKKRSKSKPVRSRKASTKRRKSR